MHLRGVELVSAQPRGRVVPCSLDLSLLFSPDDDYLLGVLGPMCRWH